MSLMLLSNPGMHLALLGNPKRKSPKFGYASRKVYAQALRRAKARVGHRFTTLHGGSYSVRGFSDHHGKVKRVRTAGVPWSGRRGRFTFFGSVKRKGRKAVKTAWTNPLRLLRNPMNALAAPIAGIKSTPATLMSLKKPNVKTIAAIGGGLIGAWIAGGIAAGQLNKFGGKLPQVVVKAVASPIGAKVTGAALTLAGGAVLAMIFKKQAKEIMAGATVAAVLNATVPEKVVGVLQKIPGLNAVQAVSIAPYIAPGTVPAADAANGATNGLRGLGAYVTAPGYQGSAGLGAYKTVPGYQGVGRDVLAGYKVVGAQRVSSLEDPVRDRLALAGVGSYLDEASNDLDANYLDPVGGTCNAEAVEA